MTLMSQKPKSIATLLAALSVAAVLGGCAETGISSSSNPSRDAPRAWRDYDHLPFTLYGSIPGRSQADLAALFPSAPGAAAGRHIVMYVNAAQLPAKAALCADPAAFQPGPQQGQAANVTSALCDGNREVTRASGTVLTSDQSPRWLVKGFDQVRDQLYQSLYPGTNDPSKWRQN